MPPLEKGKHLQNTNLFGSMLVFRGVYDIMSIFFQIYTPVGSMYGNSLLFPF